MIAIATLFVVILLILLASRVATVVLMATGVPVDVARFQARSVLTGVGYTTRESESVVNHPIRRRIILNLMLVGNAGFVTIMASVILTFAGTAGGAEALRRLAIILLGMAPIFLVARSDRFAAWLSRVIARSLDRWSDLDLRVMVHLMQLTHDYAVSELQVQPGDWVAGKQLIDLGLPDEGVLVLGVQCADGSFIGAPRGGTVINVYDMLVLYGRSTVLADLDVRSDGSAGDRAHRDAVTDEMSRIVEDQDVGQSTEPARPVRR